MTDFTAGDAQQLKEHPILQAAFSSMEKAFVNEAVMAEGPDDDARARAMMGIQVIRYIQRNLDKVIFDSAKNASKIASDVAKKHDSWA
tara:strand:+ start:1816 stop:2079 length:264 start_codon:yes stop_codon:yes gene_type:complete